MDKRLARTCRMAAAIMVAILAQYFFPPMASQAGAEALAADDKSLGLRQTRRLISLAQPKLADPAGWAADIVWALQFSGIPLTAENLCAMIATVDQESNFKANPPVEGLGRRSLKALNAKLDRSDFKSLVLRSLFAADPSIKKNLFDRLRRARTERDIDVAYRKLVGEILTVESIIHLDSDFGLGAAEFFEAQNEITTIGSMQVSVVSALEFERRYLRRSLYFEDIYRVRDYLYTRRGGLLAGTRQLLGYKSGYSRKLHRFADYNAGRYSSRNAAFQWVVSTIDGADLVLDGDLLIYREQAISPRTSQSERAINRIDQKFGLGLGTKAIRKDLSREKEFEFTETATYKKTVAVYRSRYGIDPPFARVPQIKLESVKLDRPLTTEWFARRVDRRYRLCMGRVGR
ncbi:MAG: DUF1615 family protein [Hoeflea sp.]|uniref:DUF1615 family protein n=1 Tax=Hoeflea sp. TaxID=1940281 RepID=UPI003EF6725A